jgi:hypothetical protein
MCGRRLHRLHSLTPYGQAKTSSATGIEDFTGIIREGLCRLGWRSRRHQLCPRTFSTIYPTYCPRL